MPPRKKTERIAPPAKRASALPGKAQTINDIARLAEVSKKTVSRVINQSPLVHKETRDRVEAVMREFNYTPDPFARGLANPGAKALIGGTLFFLLASWLHPIGVGLWR